jgi:hypothetical protein
MSLDRPVISVEDMQRQLRGELSLGARLRYTGLLLVTLCGAIALGELLRTEADLPARTRLALLLLVGINLGWAAFAGWVLTRRRVLLGEHRVIAARMSVVFAAVFVIGTAALAAAGTTGLGYGAVAMGFVLFVVAMVLHGRARRSVKRLIERRDALARETRAPDGRPASR